MNVTLRPLEPGMWTVGRGAERYAGRVSLLQTFCDWELVWAPTGAAGEQVQRFRKFRDARAWLESGEGQVWLDSLPRSTDRHIGATCDGVCASGTRCGECP